ncbi:hypothetical protein ACQY0O_005645 [Thecaphora frezii]
MRVFRHLGPTAVRALFLVFACSFVRAMFPGQVLDQFRGIPAKVADQLPQELLRQPHQTDPSGSWHQQSVTQGVPFGHIDFPLGSDPAQGYQTSPQNLYDGHVHQHHQSDPYNQQLYPQELVQHDLPRDDQLYYGGGHPFQQSNYHNLPASSIHQLPPDAKLGYPGTGLESSPIQGNQMYSEYLPNNQVPQHHQLDYDNQALYGQGQMHRLPVGPPQQHSIGAVDQPHYAQWSPSGEPQLQSPGIELGSSSGQGYQTYHDQGHQFQPSSYYNPSYGYNKGGQPSNEPVHGAGPSHLPDEIQGIDPSGSPSLLKWFQALGKWLKGPKDYKLPYNPEPITDFLGLDVHQGAGQLETENMEKALKEQFGQWAQDVKNLFNHEYVSKLREVTQRSKMFFANIRQKEIVFNAIMQRILETTNDVQLIKGAYVLKGMVDEERLVTRWMREKEESKERWLEKPPNSIDLGWQSDYSLAIFDLNEYRIFIGRRTANLGDYYAYRVER